MFAVDASCWSAFHRQPQLQRARAAYHPAKRLLERKRLCEVLFEAIEAAEPTLSVSLARHHIGHALVRNDYLCASCTRLEENSDALRCTRIRADSPGIDELAWPVDVLELPADPSGGAVGKLIGDSV